MRPLPLLLALLMTAICAPAQAVTPAVVATLRPLHSIAAFVMEGAGEPRLLLHGAASPHSYALRPSDARLLDGAAIVVWVGPALETFLAKPLAALARKAEIIALADLPGARRLPARSGGLWEQEHDEHGHEPAEAAYDGHLWLDIDNAKILATALADALARRDPTQAALYHNNLRRLTEGLDRLDGELRERLATLQAGRFLVLHDAYQYFERRYGLQAAGAFAFGPEKLAGAQRIAALRRRLLDDNIRCVFHEPQVNPRPVRPVVETTAARLLLADPFGIDLKPGPELYSTMLRRLAEAFRSCLWGAQ